jgi:hypothetical protein
MVSHVDRETQDGVIENRVLRKEFGPKRDEVARKWRRLHKEEWDGDWTQMALDKNRWWALVNAVIKIRVP